MTSQPTRATIRAPSLHLGFLLLPLLPLLSLSICVSPALGAVLAIGSGTDYMKASLMKPGIPFDVLLNKDSKRNIQSSAAWKGEGRLFGSDAYNLVSWVFCSVLFVVLVCCLRAREGWEPARGLCWIRMCHGRCFP